MTKRFDKSLSPAAKKEQVVAACDSYGEVFIHYRKASRKPGEPWSTQLQGTMDFSDKYLSERFVRENPRPAKENEILVFSRTNDRFRYLPVDSITKIEHLGTVVNKARVLN